jgi:hypothetical protein
MHFRVVMFLKGIWLAARAFPKAKEFAGLEANENATRTAAIDKKRVYADDIPAPSP